jgi:ATP-dependent RNA helicase DDX49/DBP8
MKRRGALTDDLPYKRSRIQLNDNADNSQGTNLSDFSESDDENDDNFVTSIGEEVQEAFELSRIRVNPRLTGAKANPLPVPPISTSFLSLGISPPLRATLSNMSIRVPTEIQAACIPPILSGKFYFLFYYLKLTCNAR